MGIGLGGAFYGHSLGHGNGVWVFGVVGADRGLID